MSCTFITKHGPLRQPLMMSKMPFIAEHRPHHRRGGFHFNRAVEFIVQVSGGEMHFATALSAEGETVAALATHMQEAELSADSRRGG